MSEPLEPLDDEELEAIREREQGATKGPWLALWERDPGVLIARTGGTECVRGPVGAKCSGNETEANAIFIAHAREDIPRLLATIAALEERARAAENKLEGIRAGIEPR